MSTLNVPRHYKTIQAAIDGAHSGDTIMIAPGIYHEAIQINKKEHLSIVAHPGTVTIDGEHQYMIGIQIESHHTQIKGIQVINFCAGVVSIGNHNLFNQLICASHQQSGISFIGNHNQVLHCHFKDNQSSGLSFAGNHNIFKANRVQNCLRGIVALGPSQDNYFIKNLLNQIETYALGIVSVGSTHNTFYKNTIDHSKYGILIQNGSSQLVKNHISHCQTSGILISYHQAIISQNTLRANETGLDLCTDHSEITGNTIQSGNQTGIHINGNYNKIVQNVVLHYNQVGILINGYHNKQSKNMLQANEINLIENNLLETNTEVNDPLED